MVLVEVCLRCIHDILGIPIGFLFEHAEAFGVRFSNFQCVTKKIYPRYKRKKALHSSGPEFDCPHGVLQMMSPVKTLCVLTYIWVHSPHAETQALWISLLMENHINHLLLWRVPFLESLYVSVRACLICLHFRSHDRYVAALSHFLPV